MALRIAEDYWSTLFSTLRIISYLKKSYVFQKLVFECCVGKFIHLVICLTTGKKPLPKRARHIVRSRASSFKWEYPLLSLRLPNSFLCLLLRLPVTSHTYLCFGNRLSRKSNNVVVFLFAFHIAVQQPFKPLWSRLLLYDLEPSQASFVLHFKSLLMTLRPGSEEFHRSSLLVGISLRLVPNLLACPAWETLLVATLPPV